MGRSSGPTGLERQARLKQPFGVLYPGVVAGEWMPAWLLAEQLISALERRPEGSGGRVVDAAHCEFRGGRSRPIELRALRTRTDDSTVR